MQAAEAADGRSMKISSRTINSPLALLVTPGVTPPRERTKMKKETISTTTVVVLVVVVEAVVVARADVVAKDAVEARDVVEAKDVVARDRAEVVPAAASLAVVLRVVFDAVVVLFERVIVQEVAAPLASVWQTTGWKGMAEGGQVSCVKDMRYLSHKKVKRLFPTQASGVVLPLNTPSKPFKKAGATATIF